MRISAVFDGLQGGTSGGKGVQRSGGDVSTAPGASKTDLAKDEVDRAAEEYSYNSSDSAKDPNPRFYAEGDRGTKLTVCTEAVCCLMYELLNCFYACHYVVLLTRGTLSWARARASQMWGPACASASVAVHVLAV